MYGGRVRVDSGSNLKSIAKTTTCPIFVHGAFIQITLFSCTTLGIKTTPYTRLSYVKSLIVWRLLEAF